MSSFLRRRHVVAASSQRRGAPRGAGAVSPRRMARQWCRAAGSGTLARVELSALAPAELPSAARLLRLACPLYRAAEVAEEKLFGAAPGAAPQPLAAHLGGELVGVACQSGAHLRLLAVAPHARGRGVGGALLAACEGAARALGVARVSVLDQPGNYLAPGVDERDRATLAWLGRRGYSPGTVRCNLLVDLAGNPLVTPERAARAAASAGERGYQIRRATGSEPGLGAAIAAEFGGAWPFEVARALELPEPGVHLAERDGEPCAFAAHDGNNRGLGWFGPAGTWPAHRGRRLGEALLLACLVDIARVAASCEIAWIGPEPFYRATCGVAGRRIFVPMRKALQ